MIDIINAYVKEGYSCVLVTGRLVERGTPLHSSVKVEKIIKYNRNSTFNRLFTWFWATIRILGILWIKYPKGKLFIVSNPPFAPLLPLVVKNPYSLLIFDIFPNALSESGILPDKSLIIQWWKKANKKVFTKADRIFTISEGMKQILHYYAKPKEVELVPIWTDNDFLKPVKPDNNIFISKHNLLNKFVVLYSGSIGLSGVVEMLVDIAAEIHNDNIVFVIIGEGVRKAQIKRKIMSLNLKNVLLLPWQSVKDLPYSLSSANLAVIGLGQKVSRLAIPSKLYSYLSVGAPILCFAENDSEISRFISEYRIGKTFDSTMKAEVIDYIELLEANPDECKFLSDNALLASKNFSSANVNKFL